MFSLNQLIAGIVLLVAVGLGAFFYRNAMERPESPGEPVACTLEAKVCPDGTSVGREGPNCEFRACAFPNIEFADATIVFALPSGYTKGVQQPGADGEVEGLLDFYQKPAKNPVEYHYLSVYRFPLPEGETAEEVILAHTRYQPSDMQATDFSKFSTKTIGGKTFRVTVIERFEGQVLSAYYLVRGSDVLRFDILERDVTEWTNPSLVVTALPEHQALETLLSTLQVGTP